MLANGKPGLWLRLRSTLAAVEFHREAQRFSFGEIVLSYASAI